MKLLAAFLVLSALIAAWVVWIRPWLRDKPWAAGFFAKIEPFEIAFYKKSESILWARFLQFVGLLVPFLQFVGAIDITPYAAIIPDGWGPYLMLVVFVCGAIGAALRKDTTKPLEVAALPEDKPPELAAAVSRAEAATDRAVVAAETAKATGTV